MTGLTKFWQGYCVVSIAVTYLLDRAITLLMLIPLTLWVLIGWVEAGSHE